MRSPAQCLILLMTVLQKLLHLKPLGLRFDGLISLHVARIAEVELGILRRQFSSQKLFGLGRNCLADPFGCHAMSK